ncbi:MAG: hypothetical protein LBL30_03440 [Holosporales bacterium]|jgi:hypothetical protein|nr:hypothetical protein [Holosporales bacterium]
MAGAEISSSRERKDCEALCISFTEGQTEAIDALTIDINKQDIANKTTNKTVIKASNSANCEVSILPVHHIINNKSFLRQKSSLSTRSDQVNLPKSYKRLSKFSAQSNKAQRELRLASAYDKTLPRFVKYLSGLTKKFNNTQLIQQFRELANCTQLAMQTSNIFG